VKGGEGCVAELLSGSSIKARSSKELEGPIEVNVGEEPARGRRRNSLQIDKNGHKVRDLKTRGAVYLHKGGKNYGPNRRDRQDRRKERGPLTACEN